MKTVVVSGYFDPIHKGHLDMFREARSLGDKLVVIVNNDEQAIAKKGYAFMPAKDRVEIIKQFSSVSHAIVSIDEDRTVCKTLALLKPDIFANGGDRFADNIPEKQLCEELGIEMVFNIGGDKTASSSELVNRVWGHWEVLSSGPGYKIKILTVLPHHSLSYQRHFKRSEHWVVISGVAVVKLDVNEYELKYNESCYIPVESWHQLKNNTDDVLQVCEIATGDYIEEDDIERLNPNETKN